MIENAARKLSKSFRKKSQKVLKKTVKNDKMYIEVFFKTYENIAVEKDLAIIKEKDD